MECWVDDASFGFAQSAAKVGACAAIRIALSLVFVMSFGMWSATISSPL